MDYVKVVAWDTVHDPDGSNPTEQREAERELRHMIDVMFPNTGDE